MEPSLSARLISTSGHEPVSLERANLKDAVLRCADLSGADLKPAKLHKGALKPAVLSQTSLSKSNLSEADLEYAVLIGADLSDANLSRATLREADLSGTKEVTNPALLGIGAAWCPRWHRLGRQPRVANASLDELCDRHTPSRHLLTGSF